MLATRPPCEFGLNLEQQAAPGARSCDAQTRRWVLAATILGSSMVFIDSSVVNVALPTIQRDLGATAAATQWVIEAYALFLAALILVGGSLGDELGRRRIFVIGTALFAATSIWCGLAPNVGNLIAARAAQGIAGAMVTPASLAIISASFTDETERGQAIGTWSGFTAITSALGPVLGGWLVENLSWRWVFLLNLPFAAGVLAIAMSRVPESRDPAASRLDWPGAFLTTIGLGTLVYGLIEAPSDGWGDPLVLSSLIVGVVSLTAFVAVERRSPSPMVPLSLFRSRTFSGANLLTLFLYAGLGGALYFVPFNLIEVQGYSSTAAGAAFLPFVILMFGLSRWSGGLIGKYGAKLPLVVGPLIAAVGFVLFAIPGIGGSYWVNYFPAVVVLGIGMSITVAPLTTAVLDAVETGHAGIASGINNSVARTASLLAIALFGILVAVAFDNSLDNRLDDLQLSPEARSEVEAERDRLAGAEAPAGFAPETQAAVNESYDRAFLSGFRLAMIAGAVLAVLSAAGAWWLVEGKPVSRQTAQAAAAAA